MKSRESRSWFREIIVGAIATVVGGIICAILGFGSQPVTPRQVASGTFHVASDSHESLPIYTSNSTVVGDWYQYIPNPYTQQLEAIGHYRVSIDDGRLSMTMVDYARFNPLLTLAVGFSDLSFDGAEWRFKTHLEDGRVLEFRLQKRDDSAFEGWSYYNDIPRNHNVWIRVQNPRF